jgi:hypothetical protein
MEDRVQLLKGDGLVVEFQVQRVERDNLVIV